MKHLGKVLLAGLALSPLVAYQLSSGSPAKAAQAATPADAEPAAGSVPYDPNRQAYFGDLHLHTINSFDAYVLMGTRVTPDEAFKFARGDTIPYLGGQVHLGTPLDFLAVTDHSENIGVFKQLEDPSNPFGRTEIGKLARSGGVESFKKIATMMMTGTKLPMDVSGVTADTWDRLIAAADTNNQPGRFTTFIAYEWTSMPDGRNMHRNVIFSGRRAPAPFTSLDSNKPQDLWAYLGKVRHQGYDAIAIPHNANASNGLMYDWNTMDGRPIDEAYAQLRAINEPVAEISQNKGTSETHPSLSSNDEFANFEIMDKELLGGIPSKPPGSYWRDALGRGLVIGAKIGTNPFKDGAIGASDLHSGLSVQSEQDYGGIGKPNLGRGKLTKKEVRTALGYAKGDGLDLKPLIMSPGSLTGAWAESNTRDAIFAAFRRKETFATSGTRIKLRFFGGWNFKPDISGNGWVADAYRQAVPMGSDLPAAGGAAGPDFAIQAVKDPNSGNLDRVQVVKVWLDGGKQRERVFDVAWAGDRRVDPGTGKLPAIGTTVDLKTATYTNAIGAAQLATVWHDPTFKADQAAVYYARVLEIPTPRWSTLRAVEYKLPLPAGVPATIQERAWSSPIWYTPPARAR